MRPVRLITGMCLVLGMSIFWATPVFASEIKTTTITTNKTVTTRDAKTTDTAIKFEEDEYIRITTPQAKDEVKTFEKQINVMGEARANTKLTITVYYENPEERLRAGKAISKTYDLIEVGATSTFNQSIELEVGKNRIVIKYEYDKKTGTQEFIITRQSEEEKEKLKTFIANSPAPFKS